MPILFALVGATGIGKSKLSLDLADMYNAEIIGVDSRQIYEGFAIGTAQPSAEDCARIKHRLVNTVSPSQVYSAGSYCADVKSILEEKPERNYILVGGTGLYLQSLMLGLPKMPQVDAAIRETFEFQSQKDSVSLYELAKKVDPEAMKNVECNNVQRVIRILEVFEGTGRKLSDWQKEREGGIGNLPIFWLQRSRENLYARINNRVDQMVKDGWLEEICQLAKDVPMDAPAWQSLGYRELLQAQSSADVERILEDVKRKTRNYAKRQLTWFRWQVDSIGIDLDLESDPLSAISRQFSLLKL